MAKISLRSYNQEIETMVENRQLDEAIAHCRHILNTYPKNLETYRLLGKAYLEAKSYEEAVNIFQRVIMAVPGDFVSHVGMSIINDERNKLDEAIWHMERAFESQPSNAAIQAELQRLYGRRDGVEPPKIRLTRGALAHMYVQGELYPQAISEISSVLEEDSERQDMRVLLARAYFHSGQKSEAAEICSSLLLHYPYNLDANRVLVELLPESERTEGNQVYRHRINELDPYAAYATGSVFRTSEVPDGAVGLERLDWDGQSVELVSGWETSPSMDMGGEVSEAPDAGKQPDWLKAGLSDDELSAIAATGEPVPAEGSDSDIPDFLRQAGWSEDSGSFDESAPSIDSSIESDDQIERAELPDWVKEMAPEGMDGSEFTSEPAELDETFGDDSVPDWLKDIESEEQVEPVVEQGEDVLDEIPDWLGDTSQETAAPAAEGPQERPTVPPADLSDLGSSSSEQDDAVAWLEGLATKHGAKPEELVSDPEARTDVEPEWVTQAREVGESIQRSMDDTAEKEAEQPEDSVSVTPPVEESLEEGPAESEDVSEMAASISQQDDALAWLESLETEHEEKPGESLADIEEFQELVAEPSHPISEAPVSEQESSDVVEEPAVEEPFLEEVAPEEPSLEEPAPEETGISSAPPEAVVDLDALGTSAEEQDDAVAWLESLATKHGAKPEELVTDSEARKDAPPEWVRQASAAAASASAEQGSAGADAEPAPEEQAEAGEPDWKEQAREVGESLYDELEELNAEEPAQPASSGETDMWLQELGGGGFDDTLEPEKETSDWTLEEQVEQGPVEPSAGDEARVEMPEMKEEVSELESGTAMEPDTAIELDEVMPEEFSSEEELEVSAPAEEKPAGSETDEAQIDELPGWLAGMEDSGGTEAAAPSDEPPEWISQEEPLQEEPSQEEPLVEELVPTAPDEWQPVADQEPAQPEAQSQPEQPEPQPEPVDQAPAGMTAGGVVATKTDHTLNQAREELSRANIPAALDEYNKLIKKGKFLDETIYDLREALYRYPVEVSIWQSLGDAYMRDNRLQDALDAYTKAEELLR